MTDLPTADIPLQWALHWEKTRPEELWLTQPFGGGQVREFTWKQALDQSRRMASHLRSLELPPASHVAIFSKNSAWWVMADLAIWMAGHVSVPLYPTLTPESVRQILEHSDSKLIFIGKLDGYENMAPGIPADMPAIELPLGPGTAHPHWDKLVADSQPLQDLASPSPDQTATIIYTSGSTGNPKGALHSHGNLNNAARGIAETLHISPQDRYISYLPMAHVLDRWLGEICSLGGGYPVYFAEALPTFLADLRRARPTLFMSVPRLWQKFNSGVSAKMPPKRLALLLKIPIVRGIIRKKILTQLGLEHVRFAGSGSAPIPAELIQWYRDLGLELLEGYGMTENFAYSHVTKPGRSRVGYVGHPCPGVEHKISEQGEILVKSPATMQGYYKMPEITAECFTDDGYFKTGDRGDIDSDGRLRITGRVKELFKTSKGKYVAPAPIENKLLLHEAVEMACVTGSGHPQPHAILQFSEEQRKSGYDKAQLTASLTEFLAQTNSSLDHHEQLAFVVVAKDEWLVDNGFLTPTMKIKRAKLEDVYGPQAEGWYAEKKKVIWES